MHTQTRNARARSVQTFNAWSVAADSSWHFHWTFGTDDAAFEGHFPQRAVLPGVFLIEMAEQAALFALERSGATGLRMARVERFRFAKPVTPGDQCELTLQLPTQAHSANGPLRVAAAFHSAGIPVANGTLALVAAGNHDHL
jgi:3-hydroxyacyl-[acyl-carrier-protein] dehydratase